jgi:hypothetical protein
MWLSVVGEEGGEGGGGCAMLVSLLCVCVRVLLSAEPLAVVMIGRKKRSFN